MDEVVDKKALAAQLKEAANLLEVLGEDPFRARAFQSAARQLEAYEGDFAALYLGGRLTEIRGVGAGLAAELSQPRFARSTRSISSGSLAKAELAE